MPENRPLYYTPGDQSTKRLGGDHPQKTQNQLTALPFRVMRVGGAVCTLRRYIHWISSMDSSLGGMDRDGV